MIAPHIKTGLFGEIYASRYLRDNGYGILSANYRTIAGEIDIIAEKDGTICFVEVKTRQEGGLFPPAAAVDFDKRSRIEASANIYLKAARLNDDMRQKIRQLFPALRVNQAFYGNATQNHRHAFPA